MIVMVKVMELKNIIKENTCYIVPNVLKEKIENYVSNEKLSNAKVITFKDVENYLSFTYTEDALYFLVTTCNLSLPVAQIVLDTLPLLEDKNYNVPRLDKFVVYYRILKEYKKLKFNTYGEYFLKRFPVVVLGFDFLTKKQNNLLDKVKTFTSVQTVSLESPERSAFQAIKYVQIEDEVEGLAIELAKLLEQGIKPNKIHLVNLSSEYTPYIERIFSYYELPFLTNSKVTLYETMVGKDFLELLKSNTFEETVTTLKEKYTKKDEVKLVSACVDILNNYLWFDGEEVSIHGLITNDVKSRKVTMKTLQETFNESDILHNYFEDDEYVFIIGANQGSFPILEKDEHYITDEISSLTLKEDSVSTNKQRKEGYMNSLRRIKNLYVSYKEVGAGVIYYPSSLLNEMNFEIKEGTIDLKNNYGHEYQKLRMTSFLDELKNYNILNSNLPLLSESYGISDYLSYQHQFVPFKESSWSPRLSYTSLSTYFECAFKYYLSYLLSLNDFEETFAQKVGNIYHYILSIWEKDREELEKELKRLLSETPFDAKEQVWWEPIREHLFYIIEVLKEQKECTDFKTEYHEREVLASVTDHADIALKGIIDKIMTYEQDGIRYAFLVDYKTGNPDISYKYLKYGFGMQLPFYLYLMHHAEEFKDVKLVGFYLQKCLNYHMHTKPSETIEELKKNSLRLEGYSLDNPAILSHLDKTYENSEWIKGLKVTKNGYSAYAKMVTDSEMTGLLNQMEDNIVSAYKDIQKGSFTINPKVLEDKNRSCSFCPFGDICFKNNNDTVYLGGEENG